MLFETMKFEPRDMNRIQPFCDRLAKAWEKLTDWRFGQLMVNLMRDYEEMECAICHRKESSKTRCVNGHYICNECHMAGLDTIIGLCLKSTSRNPVEIIESMMAQPYQKAQNSFLLSARTVLYLKPKDFCWRKGLK